MRSCPTLTTALLVADKRQSSRGAMHPRFGLTLALLEEGAGKAGCALHRRSRVQGALRKTHTSIQVQRKHSGLPCTVVLRLTSRSCVRKIWQNVRTGGSRQPPVAGSEPVSCLRPREPDGERGTDPVSSSTRTVAWASSPEMLYVRSWGEPDMERLGRPAKRSKMTIAESGRLEGERHKPSYRSVPPLDAGRLPTFN